MQIFERKGPPTCEIWQGIQVIATYGVVAYSHIMLAMGESCIMIWLLLIRGHVAFGDFCQRWTFSLVNIQQKVSAKLFSKQGLWALAGHEYDTALPDAVQPSAESIALWTLDHVA